MALFWCCLRTKIGQSEAIDGCFGNLLHSTKLLSLALISFSSGTIQTLITCESRSSKSNLGLFAFPFFGPKISRSLIERKVNLERGFSKEKKFFKRPFSPWEKRPRENFPLTRYESRLFFLAYTHHRRMMIPPFVGFGP